MSVLEKKVEDLEAENGELKARLGEAWQG